VWAYSEELGGSLSPNHFSIQFPQRIVQRTSAQLLAEGVLFSNHSFMMKSLPASGITLLSLFESVAKDEMEETLSHTNNLSVTSKRPLNTLLRILLKIPIQDFHALQRGVRDVAGAYSYYSINKSMSDIPTATHTFPTGGAIKHLEQALVYKKNKTINAIQIYCRRELARKHNYIDRYPCESFKR